MIDIKIKIPGSQTDPDGPLPAAVLKEYTNYVRSCFYDQFKVADTAMVIDDVLAQALLDGTSYPMRPSSGLFAPIRVEKFKTQVFIDIYWGEKPNFAADFACGIINALFGHQAQIKALTACNFTAQMSTDRRGWVDVRINIIK